MVAWMRATTRLSASEQAVVARRIWNDSREVRQGDVFVAIATEKDDGHRYVANAFAAGAAAVVVARSKLAQLSRTEQKRAIAVTDPLLALQRCGRRYRRELDLPIIGITGSSGKTTTRAFIAAVLRARFIVGETYTNWNNHLGVPLTLLRFGGNEDFGVIEMGANHVGEIRALSKIALPDIAVITNIGYSHVGLFGGLANTTKAKFEIAEGLGRSGFMLLNGDDPRLWAGARRYGKETVWYGVSPRCSVRAENIAVTPDMRTVFSVDGEQFELSMPGRHFVYSALPALYLGREFGVPVDAIANVLRAIRPVSLRGGIERKNGAAFIVDCYNANPSSMAAGLALLADVAPADARVAIVGDMLELGRHAKQLHRVLGKRIVDMGVSRLLAVGEFARDMADAALRAGMDGDSILTAPDAGSAVEPARRLIREGDTVLLKASRGIHLETVFERFAEGDS
jgi:UDP-N-acetylmuramoyl-tripeptide--D-alanyl-D-alanine ligase